MDHPQPTCFNSEITFTTVPVSFDAYFKYLHLYNYFVCYVHGIFADHILSQ